MYRILLAEACNGATAKGMRGTFEDLFDPP
jgi:hypothetical protein